MPLSPPHIWEEPVRGWYTKAADFMQFTGLELLDGLAAGRRLPPPIHYLTGLTFDRAEYGSAVFSMPITDWLLAPQGVVSGSALCLLADGPLGCTVQTTLPRATPYTTAEMSMNFLRPALPGAGTLTGTGTLIHAGRTIGLADVRVTDDQGNLIATAATRCVALPAIEAPQSPENEAAEAKLTEPQWETPHPFQRPAAGEVIARDVWLTRSGLDILRGCITGELPAPPIAHLCGIQPREADEGRTVWTMPTSEWLCSPVQGRLYGGAIAYIAGTALDGTYQTTVPADTAIAPVDLKVYFLRPVVPDRRDLIATGTLINRSRTVAVATSEVHDADGKLVAVAMGSALILPGRPPSVAGEDVAPA
jgi:uncharacterized protein (TIGR00369 family)